MPLIQLPLTTRVVSADQNNIMAVDRDSQKRDAQSNAKRLKEKIDFIFVKYILCPHYNVSDSSNI